MQIIPYKRLNETLYVDRLPNGLTVYVLPKQGFQKTYATFATKYGSIDNHFQAQGAEEMRVPDGIAHFLEHKMFEEPEGDVFNKFSTLGASANAFTSFDRTVYLFSATEHVTHNLETLLDFVQRPYWTEESVEKEKGIIGQEIKMYQDNPDWRAYYGLIEAMYKVHPIHIDIAGTIESISKITKQTLLDCYHTFYHPSNMVLFIVGGVEPNEIIQFVTDNQASKTFPKQGEINRFFEPEPSEINEKQRVSEFEISLPKCLMGFKEDAPRVKGKELLKQELTTKLMMDMLFSGSSPIYQRLYDEGLISDGFGYEYNCALNYAFSMIGGDTKDPEQLIARLKQEIGAVMDSGIDAASFERIRKKRIGSFLRMLNSPEAIANDFTKYLFNGMNMFDILPIYEQMTVEEVNSRLREHFDWSRSAVNIVKSK
ncbi:insulinase family protein [Paenibacillus albiflavus]|uniref:Insulinase family protein n=1 Tax=Paenibacillus albiflavus TaxID=2545760 RepID=A0A4R4EJ74_9BACL|nr:pitrilysin family protein [Paenibacillus albiflavus]TCZ80236.1 insulinase family protein [Paenibacillus albiflavus]